MSFAKLRVKAWTVSLTDVLTGAQHLRHIAQWSNRLYTVVDELELKNKEATFKLAIVCPTKVIAKRWHHILQQLGSRVTRLSDTPFRTIPGNKTKGYKRWVIEAEGLSWEIVSKLVKYNFGNLEELKEIEQKIEAAWQERQKERDAKREKELASEHPFKGLAIETIRNGYHNIPHIYFVSQLHMPTRDWQPSTDKELVDHSSHRHPASLIDKASIRWHGWQWLKLELPGSIG